MKKSPLQREVTAAESQQFLRDGVICLRNIIAPEWVELAREGVEDQRKKPSAYATVVDAENLYLLVDQMPSVENEKLRRVVYESGAGEIARRLIGREQLRWMYDQLFYKGSGMVAETPWHQDTVYGFVDGLDIVRVWMPLDHVPRETAIEVVRGSHWWNIEYAVARVAVLEDNKDSTTTSKFDYLATTNDGRPALPQIEAHRDAFDIVGYEVNPGDVVAFNYHVLHHAGQGMNLNDKRRAFAMLYAGDGIVMKRRPNPVPGPLELAGIAWQEGQSLGDFPEVFRAV